MKLLTTIMILASLTIPALAQTAPADRTLVQQPTLQEQIDGVVGKITGNISDLRTAIIQYAGQADAARQQLAEAHTKITDLTKQVADLTKQLADAKAPAVDAKPADARR
jgi:phage-related minor tail protein